MKITESEYMLQLPAEVLEEDYRSTTRQGPAGRIPSGSKALTGVGFFAAVIISGKSKAARGNCLKVDARWKGTWCYDFGNRSMGRQMVPTLFETKVTFVWQKYIL